jgi:hypothetical protein
MADGKEQVRKALTAKQFSPSDRKHSKQAEPKKENEANNI